MWGTDFASSPRLGFIYMKHSLSNQQSHEREKTQPCLNKTPH